MDTGQLKRFACQARVMLKQGVKNRLEALGFVEGAPLPEQPTRVQGATVYRGNVIEDEGFYDRWMALNDRIRQKGIPEVYEEAAYTWFNRLVALTILTRNDLCEPVLNYEDDLTRVPNIVTAARRGRFPVMTESQRRSLMRLLDDDSKTFEQFNVLITAFCHNNPIIRACFGGITEYTEMLLPTNILAQGGFLDLLNHTDYITDDDFKSPELIGWLYQFYISERKDEVMAKSGKYTPDEIPAATQIFTPNWIVKYMVQNTVGRIYLDNNPSDADELKPRWKYLVDCEQRGEKLEVNDLTELKVADLACGSGHILNECFDLLLELYINEGYSRRDAIEKIFAKNLLGIDIDTRAKQLATFSLLLKACRQDQAFLDAHALPRIYDMPRPFTEVMREWMHGESEAADVKPLIGAAFDHYLSGATKEMKQELADAVWLMNNADSLGSIIKFNISEATRSALRIRTAEYEELLANGETIPEPSRLAMQYAYIILALTDKYSAICMNPPYMGSGRFDSVLSKYVKDNYQDSKADLFAVFMQVAIDRLADKGKYGMINMHAWMFLSSFESLRHTVLKEQTIDSLMHLGPHTFDELGGEVVQNAAFVITKQSPKYTGLFSDPERPEIPSCQAICTRSADYFRLVTGRDCADKKQMFLDSIANQTEGVYYSEVCQSNFEKIPGLSMGYWANEKILGLFENKNLISSQAITRAGFSTGKNSVFVRLWFEISYEKIGFGLENNNQFISSGFKFIPFTAGGTFRKWYGNLDSIVDWTKPEKMHRPRTTYMHLYFKPAITWNAISSNSLSCRYYDKGLLFEHAAATLFANKEKQRYLFLGLLNSNVSQYILDMLNPTLNSGSDLIASLPFVIPDNESGIREMVEKNIAICRDDWDAHETSWDFQDNELVGMTSDKYIDIMHDYGDWVGAMVDLAAPELDRLEWRVGVFKTKWETKFERLHANEEELNRQFIDIYGLQDELTPDVPMDEVTILQQGEISIVNDEIVWHDDVLMKQLISYAVGCMMGRYSIDKPGLILANQGDGMKEYEALVPDSRFEVDDDGIVPLMPRDCPFADNAVNRFAEFIRILMGEATQTENLSYVDQCLGKPLENYLVKDFWKDHKKMYQKRPIYWLFSSKKGAFQVIAYMHRMTPYTVEHIRINYLLRHIDYLSTEIEAMQSRSATLNTAERRRLDKLIKDHQECLEYEERLHAVADQQIPMDLDDGVVVNYAKFGDVLAKLN